jgi:hypothetical protein
VGLHRVAPARPRSSATTVVPASSPYKGDKISKAIMYDQGNAFSDNTYIGGWNFTAMDTGNFVSPSVWKAAPYNQDTGSTFTS